VKPGYRPEIDGLRTIAVVPVLIYHLDLSFAGRKVFEGGFLGVDIFFVISGFLITRLIRQEYLDTGRFSLLKFYERRVRRLMPTLFVVIGASYIAAVAILVPTAMVDFARSAMAAVGFVSNFYWLAESHVYGAREGLIEPLLHTWSLAVEEQFYLIFPLIYVAALARFPQRVLGLGLVAIVAGFTLAVYLTQSDFSFSFYMLLSRIWELLAGALLAHMLASYPHLGRDFVAAWAMPILGMVLIGISLLLVPLRWQHPGIGTLGAILGTMLIIWFANPREPVTRLLSSRPFVAVGLISYGLYLWHYPIYAFGRHLVLMEPRAPHYVAFVALSFIAATATYFLVESPFRNGRRVPGRVMAGSLATVAVAIFALSLAMLERGGAPGRLTGLAALYGPAEPDNDYLREHSWSVLAEMSEANGFEMSPVLDYAHAPASHETDRLWFDLDVPGEKVLIVGNSHSKDMFNALHLAGDAFPNFEFARFGMHVEIDRAQVETLMETPNFAAANTILVTFRFRDYALERLPILLEPLVASGKNVVLTTTTTEFDRAEPYTLFDRHLRRHGTLDADVIGRAAWADRRVTSESPLNQSLREIAANHGLLILDKEAYLCEPTREHCTMVTPDGRKVLFDYGHYTLHGAAFLGRRIAEMDWLAPLRSHRKKL